ALDQPADVAGPRRAQDHGGRPGRSGAEQMLDRLHRPEERPLLLAGEVPQERGDLLARAFLERREGLAAGGREREQRAATVRRRSALLHQAALPEAAQEAAQVGGAEPEIADQLGGG